MVADLKMLLQCFIGGTDEHWKKVCNYLIEKDW
jgi:hypothetical protein